VFNDGVKDVQTTNEHDSRSLEQLKSLFQDQQWLITNLSQSNGSYQTYLADLITVWKAADAQTRQQLGDGQPPTALADCFRYALIHTTIAGNLGQPSPIHRNYGDPPPTRFRRYQEIYTPRFSLW
jgi:hypothetical protein